MRIKSIMTTALFFACLIPFSSFAMLPVVDAGAILNLIKEYNQLRAQYDLLRQTYHNAQQQLDSAKKIVKDAEGHYGYGRLLNSLQDLKNREWSPNTWNDALQGLAGGNTERYHQLLQAYQQDHATLSADDYKKGSDEAGVLSYQQQINTNRAASVNASYAFNEIKQHLENVHQLSEQVESTSNSKAATDLNSRLLVELAYIQVQELKMQAIINEQLAQQNSDQISEETQTASFNTLPNE